MLCNCWNHHVFSDRRSQNRLQEKILLLMLKLQTEINIQNAATFVVVKMAKQFEMQNIIKLKFLPSLHNFNKFLTR